MTRLIRTRHLAVLLLLLFPQFTHAQEQGGSQSHPLLTDRFTVTAGAFFPSQEFKLRANGRVPGDEVDFDQAAGVSDSETTGMLGMRWRFGEKWSLWAQGWQTDSIGRATLTEDIDWEDLVFRAGTNVGAGIKNTVLRMYFGRTFSTGPKHEFGAGLGLHWMEIEAYLEGQVLVNDGGTQFERSGVSADLPLPNIGAWYYYAPSPRWMLNVSVDWLSASIGDYSGGLWNVTAGAQFQLSKHFGVGASWQYFRLDGDVDKNDWVGGAELSHSGPLLYLSANW